MVFLLFDDVEFLFEDNGDGEEDEADDGGGRDDIFGAGEVELLLEDDEDHEESGEAEGDVEELVEDLELVGDADNLDDADGAEEDEGDGGGEPPDEEDEGAGVIVVDRVVDLCDDGPAEPHETLEEAEDGPSGLGEVLHRSHKGARVREGLRVGADAYVETHVPHLGAGDAPGHGQPDHHVAEEVEDRADGEDDPGRGHLVDEARQDPHVRPQVLEEGEEVEGGLVVTQRGFYLWGVQAEHVRGPRSSHDQGGGEDHEPSPRDHLGREGTRAEIGAVGCGHHG